MKTLESIENERTQKQKDLDVENEAYHLVEGEKLELQRQIIELQGKKKDLEIILNKSTKNIKQLKNEISMLTNLFWSVKNS